MFDFGDWSFKPVKHSGVIYHHPEHVRWALFFTCIGRNFIYRPSVEQRLRDEIVTWRDKDKILHSHYKVTEKSWFSLDYDNLVRPTFSVSGLGWFYCKAFATDCMKVAAYRVARTTGFMSSIAANPIWPPSRNSNPVSYPIWTTKGVSILERIRYWGVSGNNVDLVDGSHMNELLAPKVQDAFAVSVGFKLPENLQASRCRRCRKASEPRTVA